MCKKVLVLVMMMAFVFSQFVFTPEANAGGYLFSEQGQPSVGTASVGQAALADDASTVYFNPAGMARLKKSEILLGAGAMYTNMQFQPDSVNTARGSDGARIGGFLPTGGLYYSTKLNDDLSAGIAVNTPSAAGLNYDRNWKGRYYLHKVFFLAGSINPAMSYKVNDWLSVGAGVSAVYGYLHEDIGLPNPGTRGDGRVSLVMDDWNAGYNLGVLVEPGVFHEALENTRIGVAYRSQVDLNLTDNSVDVRDFGPSWNQSQFDNAYASTTMPLPRNLTVSLYQEFLNNFALLLDFGWQDFSVMDKTLIATGSGNTITLHRNWVDVWRIGAGLHYKVNEHLVLKCGFSYDSSPIEHDTDRLPDLPMDRQLRYAGGLDWLINEEMKLSMNYEFLDMGNAPLRQQPAPTTPILSGSYNRNSGNIISLSFNWKFDGPLPGVKIKEKTIDK